MLLSLFYLAFLPYALALWPAPVQHANGSSIVVLARNFKIAIDGLQIIPADLKAAVASADKQLLHDEMAPLLVKLADLEREVHASKGVLHTLQLSLHDRSCKVGSITEEINKSIHERDESYILDIPAHLPTAVLKARTSLGLLRGLQTFVQLVYTTRQKERYIVDAPHHITDKPAYPVRGLLLDTSRNFYPIKDLQRTLQAMSWSKMNFFHWHVTDSQAWPLQIANHPELTQKGAYSPDETYSEKDIHALIAYANAIGIEVVLEVDMPAHTDSIAFSHPELIACSQKDWKTYAAEPPAGQLRITNAKAVKLVTSILTGLAKKLPGNFLHAGGDEVNRRCYEDDAETQSALNASGESLEEAVAGFANKTTFTVLQAGKTPIVWEEYVTHGSTASLDSQVVVTAWRGSETLSKILETGHRVIQVSYEYFYLDCGMGGWVGLGDSWCPYNSWWKIYSFDLDANVPATRKSQILGGEVALWSEQSDAHVVDSLLWPRAAAAAELWWLGSKGSNGQALKRPQALPRLHDLRYRMVKRGVAAKPLQPHWCALRPGACLS